MGIHLRQLAVLVVLTLLPGCIPYAPVGPAPAPAPVALPDPDPGAELPAREAARLFVGVVAEVEPVAEALCRRRAEGRNCDLLIVVDDRPGLPPNAFQTVDRAGRPVVGFTLALIADARNADEIAFVMGHEAAHHILGHIPRREQTAIGTAILAGALARASGADARSVAEAERLGAEVGARGYSKEFELEADALGAEIAERAGFDAIRGAAYFSRLPDPGDRFLGTHPPNAERQALVARVTRRLRAGG
jgi:Zn-dependent protease with chaperone function